MAGDLDVLFTHVEQLRQLAEDSDGAADSARVYDFSIRWGAVLHGRLLRLTYYDDRGALAPADHIRYTHLCAELRDVAALADRLGLAPPPLGKKPTAEQGRTTSGRRHTT
ncbi:hypothetical protein [Streptomyces montanisoli]|uniref:Uncharacterized protein n=1 Tax=Streptomyces montanisoli TaxID=2798581 RepID=A0A940M9A0_9ACTN|nr:hypothetical protein [Streptomyces montanisoli]MBP0457129.1 hypothetical protein [Streptomyces montanisoli]